MPDIPGSIPGTPPHNSTSNSTVRSIPVQRSYYPILLALFVVVFIISNVTATKGVALGPLITDGAFFLFPVAYVIGDVLSECYGFAATRRAIWTGFAAMMLAVASFYIAIALPSAPFYEGQDAFSAALGLVPRIVVASLEKSLWARLLGSTVVGECGDTLVFCLIAAPVIGIASVGDTVNYTVVGFLWKTAVEVAVMPVTYAVIRFVKNREGY